ncbi:CDP-glycerol glycerophosphotransferase family protein [Streptacidiphilus sp. EB129]|uniref:bifunctional glycosyltransferase/CDP-glycerol:glycerophosphate glycerophosphotransferase n=1 Tax=Streptacidiphilus sp. EB129 TaxID=3156262 RepID=UPI0035121BB6
MPRFSIVVPASGDTAYLRDCVDSVLGQSFQGLELIAVGDDSAADADPLLDQYAAADPRFRSVHWGAEAGMGADAPGVTAQALAQVCAETTGDYLLLLDRDIALTPGALKVLDDRLAELGDPDLLLFDHERKDWLGRIVESKDSATLAALEKGVFAAADDPSVVLVAALRSNRLFRRSFLETFSRTDDIATGRESSFGSVSNSGGGADSALVLAQRSLLAAERVGTLGVVCVQILVRRRAGEKARATAALQRGRRALDDYRLLFGGLRGLRESPDRQKLYRALNDALFLDALDALGGSRHAAEAERHSFFAAAAETCRELRPADWTLPKGAMGGRGAALEQGSYLRFRAIDRARRSLKEARGQLKRRGKQAGRTANRALYLAQLRRPVEKGLVAYMAYWNRSIACNPEAIYLKAKELAPHTRGVWVLDEKAAEQAPEGVDFVVNETRAYWELMARAEFLVSNASFSGTVVKRPEQTYVQTHHGTPLKKMGLDQREYPASTVGLSFELLLEHADQWDYSLTSNRHSTQVWERVYPSTYTTLESGYPRNDVYLGATGADVQRIRAELGIAPDQTAILYAPTHRDYRKSFDPPLDLERFCEGLGPGYVVLVRAHYFYEASSRLQTQARRGVLRDVSGHPSVEELALASDALLTDYSSLMFDYANLDRPIVVHAPDWEVYQASRGVYVDLLSGRPGDTPGIVTRDTAGVLEAFRSGAWEGAEAAGLRAAFRERFCQFDDGQAAERVVRRVFLRESEPLPLRPLADRTPAPLPARAVAR